MRHYHGRRGGGRLRLGYTHNVVVPTSTDKSIIFAVDRNTGKFNTSYYDPAMTHGTISREEIAAFLRELEPTINPIFNSPVLNFLKFYQKAHPFIMIGIFVAWIIAIILGIRSGTFQVFFVLPAIFGAFFVFVCIVLVINCYAVGNIKRLIEESKQKIMPYLDARNPEFKRRGFFWVAPNSFPYWLELWKDGAGGPMGMGMSMEQQYGIHVQDMTAGSHRPMMYNGAGGVGGFGGPGGMNNMYYGSNMQSPASGYNGGFVNQSPMYSGAGGPSSNFVAPHLLA